MSFYLSKPPTKNIRFIGMSSIDLIKKKYIAEIEKSPYKDVKHRVLYLLKYQMISKFIKNKETVDAISEIVETIIENIVKKVIQNFGSISNIIRYCLTNYFKINQEFTTDELYEIIGNIFYYYDKTKCSKYLNNQIPKFIKSVKDKRKRYYIINHEEKYFHI